MVARRLWTSLLKGNKSKLTKFRVFWLKIQHFIKRIVILLNYFVLLRKLFDFFLFSVKKCNNQNQTKTCLGLQLDNDTGTQKILTTGLRNEGTPSDKSIPGWNAGIPATSIQLLLHGQILQFNFSALQNNKKLKKKHQHLSTQTIKYS